MNSSAGTNYFKDPEYIIIQGYGLSCLGLSKGVAEGRMALFQEMMRQQLESSMHTELDKLLGTTTGAEKEVHSHTLSVSLLLFLSNHLVVI